ncbi:MAG TPA: lysine 2,3-aminomutase [Actinomycetes bacterium]|jgi:lysine 2,3-aminomutase|nr:lysine 2,3-aminomutase [Actinomycetes bacterium]
MSEMPYPVPFIPRVPRAHPVEQPFPYPLRRAWVEPDWRRLPGYAGVSAAEWESAQWQRAHSVKNLRQLKSALGELLPSSLLASLERDQAERATMSMLIPPQMLNTMDERDLWADPVRRYMLPAFDDRDPEWPSHPLATRDSLHEADMWAVEGLTHRYPTKVLAELLATCPQYCGHCTRMDLVGNSTPQVAKYKFQVRQPGRHELILDYLRRTPSVRDVVVSGGDIANLPIRVLTEFVSALLDIDSIRDIRLATKGLMGLPQHFLQDKVLRGLEGLAVKAARREVDLAVHTHVNHANQLTPLVGRAVRKLLDMGFRDVRNQGVLLRGVNTSPGALLELCFTLLDRARVLPYYFYMCDMIPNSEHWRISVAEAQALQHAIMGYLPGFATPRVVCDVPFVGKRWVHQTESYDHEKGISYWTKNYRTGIEFNDPDALDRRYEYYDPIHSLPEPGREYWRRFRIQHPFPTQTGRAVTGFSL